MERFVITYLQEAVQSVQSVSLEAAGDYAKKYAANNPGLKVLQVYPAPLGPLNPGLPPPAAT